VPLNSGHPSAECAMDGRITESTWNRTVTITVRFKELEFYDINLDMEVTQFFATTNQGTYFVTIPNDEPSRYRKRKEAFKDKVVQYIEAGMPPQEITLEDHDWGIERYAHG